MTVLTNNIEAPYNGTIERFQWGRPASANICGKEGWSNSKGACSCARRASLHREVQGGLPLETAITLGARFIFAPNIEKNNQWRYAMPNPWYTPEDALQAEDCLNNVASILAFLSNAVAQTPDDNLQISANGQNGLFFLLIFMEGAMKQSLNQIAKRRKAS